MPTWGAGLAPLLQFGNALPKDIVRRQTVLLSQERIFTPEEIAFLMDKVLLYRDHRTYLRKGRTEIYTGPEEALTALIPHLKERAFPPSDA